MRQYHELLQSILTHGTPHSDRTGVGTISHFGYQTRFDLRAGFPIVTTGRILFVIGKRQIYKFYFGEYASRELPLM